MNAESITAALARIPGIRALVRRAARRQALQLEIERDLLKMTAPMVTISIHQPVLEMSRSNITVRGAATFHVCGEDGQLLYTWEEADRGRFVLPEASPLLIAEDPTSVDVHVQYGQIDFWQLHTDDRVEGVCFNQPV